MFKGIASVHPVHAMNAAQQRYKNAKLRPISCCTQETMREREREREVQL